MTQETPSTAKESSTASGKEQFWNHPEVRSLFWMLVLILFIRGFIAEPFKIPSGSMIPTLLVGDHIFVAKSSYDMGIPFTNKKLIRVSDPKRGDVAVFEYPNHEQEPEKDGVYYIKRIIGLPGDEISVHEGIPSVNGQVVKQTQITEAGTSGSLSIPGFELNPNHELFSEEIPGREGHPHWVQRYPYRLSDLPEVVQELRMKTGKDCIEVGKTALRQVPVFSTALANEICSFRVPEGHYFMMGDNRDDSSDGRDWGFVDRSLIKGRALFVWWAWRGMSPPFLHWSRLGLGIK